jgi:hypothetical protein
MADTNAAFCGGELRLAESTSLAQLLLKRARKAKSLQVVVARVEGA